MGRPGDGLARVHSELNFLVLLGGVCREFEQAEDIGELGQIGIIGGLTLLHQIRCLLAPREYDTGVIERQRPALGAEMSGENRREFVGTG